MAEATESSLELVDLGDATAETKQLYPTYAYPDSTFVMGALPGFMAA